MLSKSGLHVSRGIFEVNQNLLRFVLENLISNGSVLHIGAHSGQETTQYSNLGVEVLWIEANPGIIDDLSNAVSAANPEQKIICALLGDKNMDNVPFYLANNGGLSSSLFQLASHNFWPGLKMESAVLLNMRRLDSMLSRESLKKFSHCVIDVQGAELRVLKGFGDLLHEFNSLEIEISTMETYIEGALFPEIVQYLSVFEFVPLWTPPPNTHQNLIFLRKGYVHPFQVF